VFFEPLLFDVFVWGYTIPILRDYHKSFPGKSYPTTRRIRDAISGFEHCSEKSSCQDLSSTQIFDALVAGTIGGETMGTIVESRPKLFGREALR
jgi:hypothetical protein